jgi:vacuolar-type H+-ATPase subunit E/Vma4
MALKDIIKSIEKEAAVKISEIQTGNESELKSIKQEWQQKIDARKDEILKGFEKHSQMTKSENLQQAKIASQKKILETKQAKLEEAFSLALKDMKGLKEREYVKLMTRLVNQLPEKEGDLVSAAGRVKHLAAAVKTKGLKVSRETVKSSGGFVYQSRDKSVDNRFENLVKKAENDLRVDVGQILFS